MTMLEAAIFLTLGFAAGIVFFSLLRWNTSLYLRDRSLAFAMALQGFRFSAVGGLFALIALYGALPLLVTALGLLFARPVVERCLIGVLRDGLATRPQCGFFHWSSRSHHADRGDMGHYAAARRRQLVRHPPFVAASLPAFRQRSNFWWRRSRGKSAIPWAPNQDLSCR